jgi:three-Cys-motif partner protein
MSKRATTVVRPGGSQTRVKLGIVGDYLKGFARASQSARDRIYIDGLAGSGTGIDPRTGHLYDGSARRCFDVEPPFTEVYIIEKDEARAAELEKIAAEHEGAKAICGDVNIEIPKLLATLNPKAPTFAFLDPEGTELGWPTVKALADHKRGRGRYKVELLILFPLQMSHRRLLNFKSGLGVTPEHAKLLDFTLGAETPWREIVARRLIGEIPDAEQMEFAFLDAYCDGLQNRLGYEHVLHVAVAGDSGAPLYYLVFASDCPAGKTIMRWEFGASHEEQAQLFNLGEYTEGISFDPDRTKNYRSAP